MKTRKEKFNRLRLKLIKTVGWVVFIILLIITIFVLVPYGVILIIFYPFYYYVLNGQISFTYFGELSLQNSIVLNKMGNFYSRLIRQ